MFWLFKAARRLRELGILGMNRRNAACILDHNPRSLFPLVDDKLRMARLCRRIGVPTPEVYAEVSSYSMLRRLPGLLGERGDFVIKPNRGSAGRGVLVIIGRDGKRLSAPQWRESAARRAAAASFRHSVGHVLAGRPARQGHRAAAHSSASGVRVHHATRAFPTCA